MIITMINMLRLALLPVLTVASSLALAQVGTYQTMDSFLSETFVETPSNETLWLNDEVRAELSAALDRQ